MNRIEVNSVPNIIADLGPFPLDNSGLKALNIGTDLAYECAIWIRCNHIRVYGVNTLTKPADKVIPRNTIEGCSLRRYYCIEFCILWYRYLTFFLLI